jgi:hypothetical protein
MSGKVRINHDSKNRYYNGHKEREETDKLWPTKYYRENERLSNTNLIKTGENSNAQEG